MLRLNDDCLSNIFNRLELRDQLRLTTVCDRFRDIILAVQWRSRFRRFQSNSEIDALLPQEYHSLLALIVDRIEHLIITGQTERRVYTWHSGRTFTLRCEFPVLRVLEFNTICNAGDIQLLAAYCPLIEELYLHKYSIWAVWPHIVRMRHLRVLHMSRCMFDVHELKQILTMPLTEFRVNKFLAHNDYRSLAEALIGASDLRVLRMCIDRYETANLMESIVALASTTELRDPLTVYITFEIDDSKDTNYIESDDDDEDLRLTDDDIYDDYGYVAFKKYKRSLKALIGDQLANPTYTILFSKNCIEFRFFHQSNKK